MSESSTEAWPTDESAAAEQAQTEAEADYDRRFNAGLDNPITVSVEEAQGGWPQRVWDQVNEERAAAEQPQTDPGS